MPCQDALEAIGNKPRGAKRVDVLKTSGKHRSRLVAKEFVHREDPHMYALMPPLDRMRILLTMAAEVEDARARVGERRRGETTTIMS